MLVVAVAAVANAEDRAAFTKECDRRLPDVLLPVEKPLVAPYLTKFDAAIEKGISSMNWKSNGISDFISDSMEQVNIVNNIVQKMKENLRL